MEFLKVLGLIIICGVLATALTFLILVAYFTIRDAMLEAADRKQWQEFIDNKRKIINSQDNADRSKSKGCKEH